MVSIPGMENIDWTSTISAFIYYLFWGLLTLILLIAFFAVYWYTSFNIKATVFPIHGSGRDGIFSVGKPKTNRIKKIKKGNVWRSLYPIFNKKNREPLDAEYIYPGRQVYIFDLNGEWIPGRINITQKENTIRAQINPVPYWIRNWADAESRVDEIEFAQQDWWTDNKALIYGLISVGLCLLLCGVTIYFTYQFATGGASQMNALTEAIKGMTGAAGAPPG